MAASWACTAGDKADAHAGVATESRSKSAEVTRTFFEARRSNGTPDSATAAWACAVGKSVRLPGAALNARASSGVARETRGVDGVTVAKQTLASASSGA